MPNDRTQPTGDKEEEKLEVAETGREDNALTQHLVVPAAVSQDEPPGQGPAYPTDLRTGPTRMIEAKNRSGDEKR